MLNYNAQKEYAVVHSFAYMLFERDSFYCWTSQKHANQIKSSHKAYVLQFRSFCFCAHTQDFKLLLQNLKLISKIHEVKTTAFWNRAAK